RPPTARSRTPVSRRPLETARTPHSGHPTTSVVVSTSIHTSPSTSTLTSTRNPRMPNRTAAGSIPSTMTYGLLSQRLVATTKRSEAMGHITVFPDSPDAPSPPTRREEPVYVSFVTDVFSRRIVGWQASRSLKTDLALNALEQAIWERNRQGAVLEGLIHHSDRGVQYLA